MDVSRLTSTCAKESSLTGISYKTLLVWIHILIMIDLNSHFQPTQSRGDRTQRATVSQDLVCYLSIRNVEDSGLIRTMSATLNFWAGALILVDRI